MWTNLSICPTTCPTERNTHELFSVAMVRQGRRDADSRRLEGLADAGLAVPVDGPIRPHVTLAHSLNVDLEPFVSGLRRRLEAHATFTLTFPGLGLFVESGVLYLSTVMTDALWALHRDVAELILEQGAHSSPYYQPDRWTPHCTLALELTPQTMLEAVKACQTVPFPLTARATRVGIIENPSEVEVLALPLPVRQ